MYQVGKIFNLFDFFLYTSCMPTSVDVDKALTVFFPNFTLYIGL